MKETAVGRVSAAFLDLVSAYEALEKRMHTYDTQPKIYQSEVHTLAAVGAHDVMNVTKLARLQGVSKSAASQTVSKLEKKGFLIKQCAPDHETLMILTEQGRAVCAEHTRRHEALSAALSRVVSAYPPQMLCRMEALARETEALWKNF